MDVYSAVKNHSNTKDLKINDLLYQLLVLIIEENNSSENIREQTKKNEISEIKNYIDENYRGKITLDSLSEQFYINKFYLTRIFKDEYGVSINNYILSLRISHAKKELRFTDKAMSEIGFDCGIGPSYYFSRVFMKAEGLTPSEYRKKWKS